ncbi:hypothetical protein [Pseudobacteriovorax antillogorgiicola]|uniref:DUF4124 domain-containing protein n=1 Tax=Pseudobacteriovorax antillogorgiicola TaxID=1513793 RepID=A0A1Y6BYA6_9BACT|nr:hypothetical protein [Pseudobacteriovorax antillogorgiicola]TCS52998.1 hypothetical protein EDD56_10849 [Pseudobacteriovorax antillogorgiicola]SMF27150.1 hypothetical protein SAMN06296036_108198 [Pseudobacteriovorax antillogorgiicola]
MTIKSFIASLAVSTALVASPGFAKKWCCQVDGKVHFVEGSKKKMCVKSKKAPSASSKPKSKHSKYFASCEQAGGTWMAKGKKTAQKK